MVTKRQILAGSFIVLLVVAGGYLIFQSSQVSRLEHLGESFEVDGVDQGRVNITLVFNYTLTYQGAIRSESDDCLHPYHSNNVEILVSNTSYYQMIGRIRVAADCTVSYDLLFPGEEYSNVLRFSLINALPGEYNFSYGFTSTDAKYAKIRLVIPPFAVPGTIIPILTHLDEA